MKASEKRDNYYFDLASGTPFLPIGDANFITIIDTEFTTINGSRMYNMKSTKGAFVLDTSNQSIFKIGKQQEIPESVHPAEVFDQHFFKAVFAGSTKFCSTKSNEIVRIGEYGVEIAAMHGDQNQKLLNISTPNGENFALDTRFGIDELSIAAIDRYRVLEALGNPFKLGNINVQNVLLETLGGSKRRTINLDQETLTVHTLSKDLLAYSEQTDPSVFAGCELVAVDYSQPIHIDEKAFYKARFIDYIKEEKSVILQQENGRPLQLDGVGHRNELVTAFDNSTLTKKYHLSEHRMIGVISLTEDLKENQLLFSLKTMSSWLPFYESYLPILKSIIDIEENQKWEYHLFELHNLSNDKEYIAVEQNPPFRILAEKVKSKYRPRIVKSKEKVLKSPEEISAIRRFFSNRGVLVGIG